MQLALPHFQERQITLPIETIEVMERTRQQDPQLFEMGEAELRAYLRQKKMMPNSTVGMLRVQFWREYDRSEGSIMHLPNIYKNIATHQTWANAIRNIYSLAWILSPLASMIAQCDERIDTLMSNMRDVSSVSPVRNGEVDRHLAKLQFEMLMYFDQRKNGAIVQKIEQTTKSTNVTANIHQNLPSDSEKIMKMVENMSEDELQKKLNQLQQSVAIEVKAE